MYLSGAVAVDEKDRNDVWGDLRILEQRAKAELLRNLVNIMKIKLIGYQVIGNIQEQGRFILWQWHQMLKLKKKKIFFLHMGLVFANKTRNQC